MLPSRPQIKARLAFAGGNVGPEIDSSNIRGKTTAMQSMRAEGKDGHWHPEIVLSPGQLQRGAEHNRMSLIVTIIYIASVEGGHRFDSLSFPDRFASLLLPRCCLIYERSRVVAGPPSSPFWDRGSELKGRWAAIIIMGVGCSAWLIDVWGHIYTVVVPSRGETWMRNLHINGKALEPSPSLLDTVFIDS